MTAQPKVIHVVPQIPGLPALADDTPSRHPCKIRIPSAQKRYIFDPYKAQVTLGLEVGESSSASDSDCDDGVNEDAFNNANDEHTSHVAPKPVDPLSPFTGAPPQQSDHTVAASVPHVVVVPRMRSLDQPAIATSDPYSAASERQSQQSTINTPPIPRGLLSLTPVPESRLHEPTASTSQRESAVGGAHYTNDDGCFRIHAGSMHHALVRFKFAEDVYVVPPGDRRGLCVGDLVVVEGDRGENIGQVTADYSDQCSQDDVSHKSIIRRALNKDRKKYYHARRKDAMASKAAQQIAQDNHLKMHVLDAEFQSDLMKLTIYFRSFAVEGEAVDFREIQRGLFKQFRCRIWLVNWYEDKSLQRIVQQQLSPQQPQQPMSLPPTPQPAPVAQQQLAPQFTQWAAMQQQPLRNDFVVSAADSANVFVPVKHINPQESYPPFPQERQSSISERFTTVLAAPTFPVPANFHMYPAQPEQSLITAQHLQIPTNPAPHTTQGLSSRATTGRFAYASRVLR